MEQEIINQLISLGSDKDYLKKAQDLWKKYILTYSENLEYQDKFFAIFYDEFHLYRDYLRDPVDYTFPPYDDPGKTFGKHIYPDGIDKINLNMIQISVHEKETVDFFLEENFYDRAEAEDKITIQIPIKISEYLEDCYFLDLIDREFIELFNEDYYCGGEIDTNSVKEYILAEPEYGTKIFTFDQLTYLLAQIKIKSYTENLKIAMENKVKVGLPNAMNKVWYYINL